MSKRGMAVAGSFYPSSCEEVEGYIDRFNMILKNNSIMIEQKDIKALIVPHAGYMYSGFTANIAYKSVLDNKKRVIVIGPSHKVYLEGISICLYDKYVTPCGDLIIDKYYADSLIQKYSFATFIEDAHYEHSTETQFPFIKHYFTDVKVVEMVYGKLDYQVLSLMIKDILKNKDNLLVISTDLSHFYELQKAKELDNICLNAIVKKDINLFALGCEACGIVGVKALVEAAKKFDLNVELLDYRTSYDITKDDHSVVGYSSFIMY